MRKKVIGNATLYLGKMEHTINQIHDVNHVLTDPPYLYIKTHDFDKKFDEKIFFEGVKDMLPDNGFIALFGRGTSFYRWNTRLADLGFVFKEDIVWDKRLTTAPCHSISRVHETISIHTKKKGIIRRIKVPYVEMKQYDIGGIADNIRRIKKAISTDIGLNKILAVLQGGELYKDGFAIERKENIGISTSKGMKNAPRELQIIKSLTGMNEKSIIELTGKHYDNTHPTEKPVRLAERILALISDPGDTIYDPFMGSGSFGVACINTGRKYIGSEMMPEYFEIACKRIEQSVAENSLWQT
jgi:site-specific DNA-methyltransferase (adenine-specific)